MTTQQKFQMTFFCEIIVALPRLVYVNTNTGTLERYRPLYQYHPCN